MTENNNKSTSLTVSAPGKLLLAGGYLVLESPNDGVVIGVDKRFFCTCTVRCDDPPIETSSSSKSIDIKVESPQFQQEWSYQFDTSKLTLTASSTNPCENGFVEKTLRLVLLALLPRQANESSSTNNTSITTPQLSSIHLVIRGDNDFYSLVPHLKEQNLPVTLEGALQLPSFLPVAKDEQGKILKTGLGSSACLVTSLVASLYHVLKKTRCISTPSSCLSDQTVIFRLAQICHCHAQGKVGSGFDVASACYGSHIYHRFPKETIADLLTQLETQDGPDADDVSTTQALHTSLVTKLYETPWEGGLQAPLTLPPFLQVMLADVSGGSESPSMARTVLAWKKQVQSKPNNSSSNNNTNKIPHWDDLAILNSKAGQLWQELVSLPTLSESELTSLCKTTAGQWNEGHQDVGRVLYELHMTLAETRKHLKAMGNEAQVPIEPPEQTELADATLKLPGVVAALVPGAGGYDALACVYLNTPETRHAIGKLWSEWPKASVCPLTVQGISFGEGVRVEKDLI